jgi:3-mercaptopyruvate sulfurtransferase SseA
MRLINKLPIERREAMRAVKMFVVGTVFLLVAVLNIQAADKRKTEPYTIVTSEELKAMLDRQEPGLVIIDARNPEEFQEVHIRAAINIPWPKVEKDRTLLTFPKETKIVFYCNGFK